MTRGYWWRDFLVILVAVMLAESGIIVLQYYGVLPATPTSSSGGRKM